MKPERIQSFFRGFATAVKKVVSVVTGVVSGTSNPDDSNTGSEPKTDD